MMTPAEAAQPALRLVGDGGQGEAGGAVFNLYAVTASDAVAAIVDACAEWDVRPVTHGDLAAIVAPAGTGFDRLGVLGSDPSSEEELDLDTLGEMARHHEAVMGRLLSVTSVVPFRIGMAVRSERDAERLLQRHAGGLREALGWVAGRAEWSVRVWSVTEAPEPVVDSEVVPEGSRSPSSQCRDLAGVASPGHAYLLERRSARERAAQALRRREKLASAILSDLEPVVAGISLRPAGARRTRANGSHPSGDGSEAAGLLDVVVLADRAADEAIFEAVRSSVNRLGGGRLRARLTGPWPPYHFVGEIGSRAGDGADDWSGT